jgi:hypothetical protein
VLTKISYATLSNSPKEFNYISNLLSQTFGENYNLSFTTNDSLESNASKIWQLDSMTIQYESFSDLNSGYELIIK